MKNSSFRPGKDINGHESDLSLDIELLEDEIDGFELYAKDFDWDMELDIEQEDTTWRNASDCDFNELSLKSDVAMSLRSHFDYHVA